MKRALLGLMLLAAACSDSGVNVPIPTPTPTPPASCLTLTITPVAGVPSLFYIEPSPVGAYTLLVNGVGTTLDFGVLGRANAGDIVQGCRGGCCSLPVVVR